MSQMPIQRRATRSVRVGEVTIGGGAPVVVQSMTNTDTANVAATTLQLLGFERPEGYEPSILR